MPSQNKEQIKKEQIKSAFSSAADQVKKATLKRWLTKARDIQWDYKNIVRRKGKLERLK